MSAFDPNDGGFASRKLLYSAGTSLGIILTAICAGHWPAIIPMYPTIVGGLLGALGVFAGANVAGKWAIGKNINERDADDVEKPAEPKPNEDLPDGEA